jgi:hypothetical protein
VLLRSTEITFNQAAILANDLNDLNLTLYNFSSPFVVRHVIFAFSLALSAFAIREKTFFGAFAFLPFSQSLAVSLALRHSAE